MNVYKRGGVYWFCFIYKGKRIRRSTHLTKKPDARDYASAYRTRLVNKEVGIKEVKPIPNFDKAIKDFLAWSKQEHQSHPATHRRYETSSVALKKYFKTMSLEQITPDVVERFKTKRAKQKSIHTGRIVRPATVNRELACLKAMFNFIIKDNDALKNPVSGVKFLDEDNEQTRTITLDEEKKYLLAASQPLQDIATMILQTGMRPEEVYRIRRENVHLEQGYLFNPYGKTKAAKRKVFLTDVAAAMLQKRLDKVKGGYLFPGRGVGDRPIIKVNNAHGATLIRAELSHFTLYSLRHTWATCATEKGVDLVTLAAMLGHSRIQMVLRYAHPSEEHQAAAMQKMNSEPEEQKKVVS
ncbi:MAG: tyrosine-type recombinase/integrase [Acidobacteriota bacterium]|nr:tyrosine-type recombinase/integrase [Acidobacteriota bacterium]